MLTRRTGKAGLLIVAVSVALVGAAACGGPSGPPKAVAAQEVKDGLKAQAAGKLDEAAKLYASAAKHDPQNKFAFYNLGVIDQNKGRSTEAETNYRQALTIDPKFVPCLYNLAIIRTAAGAKQEAIDLYRRALEADPNDAAAHLNLGFLLRDTGHVADGDAELAKAVQLDPSLAKRLPASPPPAEGPAKAATPKP